MLVDKQLLAIESSTNGRRADIDRAVELKNDVEDEGMQKLDRIRQDLIHSHAGRLTSILQAEAIKQQIDEETNEEEKKLANVINDFKGRPPKMSKSFCYERWETLFCLWYTSFQDDPVVIAAVAICQCYAVFLLNDSQIYCLILAIFSQEKRQSVADHLEYQQRINDYIDHLNKDTTRKNVEAVRSYKREGKKLKRT